MREILFRAKHKEYNQWVEGDLIHEQFGECIQFVKDGCRSKVKVDPETVCQYTGLTDKNGRKIFEGDIVRDFICIDDHNEPLYEYGKVVYIHERISFEIWDNDNNQITRIAELEVIGNIFDNHELIGE